MCPNCQKKTKFRVDHVDGRQRELLSGEPRFQTIWHLHCEKCHQAYTDSYPSEAFLVPVEAVEIEVPVL